jgi:gas vesicle protein
MEEKRELNRDVQSVVTHVRSGYSVFEKETHMAKRDSERGSFGSMLSGFFIGGLIGAVTALLVAPQSGEQTREMIREKGTELKDKAVETAEEARNRAQQAIAETRERAADVLSEKSQQAEEMTHRASQRAQDTADRMRNE